MSTVAMTGTVAPLFELEGTAGRFRLADHRGRRVVLLFYPGDDSRVSAKQFCSYRDDAHELHQLDAVVVGISGQPVTWHVDFMQLHDLTVELLADTSGRVARAYGVASMSGKTRRAVIVIDETGRIRYRSVHRTGLTFARVAHLEAVLDGLDV